MIEAHGALIEQARSLIEGERWWVANLANVSALVYEQLRDLNWCGFYLVDSDELVLGPFQGRSACIRIPFGRGVCGTCAKRRELVVVPDVHEFEGHIACDSRSASEIVAPIFAGERLIGVLDIDSPVLDRFGPDDVSAIEALADLLSKHIRWPRTLLCGRISYD